MNLPPLAEGYLWKVVANTFCEYEDGIDFEHYTEHDRNRIRIKERSTIILVAENDQTAEPEVNSESDPAAI